MQLQQWALDKNIKRCLTLGTLCCAQNVQTLSIKYLIIHYQSI